MCSSNHWNTSRSADKRSQSHRLGYSAAGTDTGMGEGEPDCDGLSEGEEDMLVGEDQEDHSSGLVEVVLRSAVEEGQGEVEEGQ